MWQNIPSLKLRDIQGYHSGDTAISIYVVGSKPQAYKTRPKGNMGS